MEYDRHGLLSSMMLTILAFPSLRAKLTMTLLLCGVLSLLFIGSYTKFCKMQNMLYKCIYIYDIFFHFNSTSIQLQLCLAL